MRPAPATGSVLILGAGVAGLQAVAVLRKLGAVVKATLMDMDLAISVYLEASETARKAVEEALGSS